MTTPTNERVLLDGRAISVRYRVGTTATPAVRDVHITVQLGETVGIVGESGSGKSTLARVLAGIQQPTEGEVFLGDVVVASARRHRSMARGDRRRIQMVFQDPYSSLNPRMRALDAVAEAVAFWQPGGRSASLARALELLSAVGINEQQARRRPGALSGGQRQRVSIARALAPQPDLLIADEPTSAIDLSAQAQLLNLLRTLQEERGLAIVIVTHNLAVVRYLASRIYVMRAGEVVESGQTATTLENPLHEYTRALLEAAGLRR